MCLQSPSFAQIALPSSLFKYYCVSVIYTMCVHDVGHMPQHMCEITGQFCGAGSFLPLPPVFQGWNQIDWLYSKCSTYWAILRAPPSAILKEETVLLSGMTLLWTLTAYGLILAHDPRKITPKLEILFFSSWQFLFLSADESFNIGLKFEIAFEVRPRSSSGTFVHGHSVNGEYLNVHMKNGQVMSWELTVHLV